MRLGFSLLAAREFTGNGISNLNRLRTLTEEALDRLIKQIHRDNQGAGLFIPFASQQHVHAIRFWANRMHIIGSPFSIEDVNEPLAEMWGESMKIEREASQAPADLIKVPEPFKKETKWRTWKESVLTYLNSKQGQASIPLSYIIREKDIPERNVIYQTVHDQLVNKAILYGPEYNRNNGIVYDLLQSLTLNGPAWSWISGFQGNRDGRGAWKSLVAYYEGDAMQTRSKQECYDAISKANYQGTKRNFNFSTYVTIHQQAYQDLIRLGEPVPENKKVRDFLQGITDPQCSNIKLNILSNPTFMNNFAQTINYMASAIDMITKNNPNNPRQISELNRNNPGRGNNRGRSSSSCDITIRNTVVSQIHCSLQRDPKNPHNFLLTDENSTNGVYMGKRRLKSVSLRHGDTFTLAPPDLANCVTISYYCPPPLWAKLLRYGFYGAGGIFGLLVLAVIWESRRVNVYPLPSGVSGPVVVYARDGQTPLNPRRQETHQELDNLGDFSPYLPKAVVTFKPPKAPRTLIRGFLA